MIVGLIVGEDDLMKPYMVLTLWSRGQKPKISSAEIPLGLVHVFRAVLLKPKEHQESQEVLEASDFCAIFRPENVFTILDCASRNHHMGTITITPESAEILDHLSGIALKAPVRVGAKKRAATAGSQGPGKKTKADPKKVVSDSGGAGAPAADPKEANSNKKAKLVSKQAEADVDGADPALGFLAQQKESKKSIKAAQKAEKLKQDENISANDIRRSQAGRKAVQKFAARIMDLEKSVFLDSPTFSNSGWCNLKGASELSAKSVIGRLPRYFECRFYKANVTQYGELVFNLLHEIWQELSEKSPVRTKWTSLIRDVIKSGVATTVEM